MEKVFKDILMVQLIKVDLIMESSKMYVEYTVGQTVKHLKVSSNKGI